MSYLDCSEYRTPDTAYTGVARFFGPDGVDPHEVRVEYLETYFSFADAVVAECARTAAARMRREGILRPGPPVMRVVEAGPAGRLQRVVVQPADYADFAGSCLAMDFPQPALDGGSLREYCRPRYDLDAPHTNPLCPCLGVCALVIGLDAGREFAFVTRRSAGVSSLAGTIGPPVAGVVDWRTDAGDLHALARDQLARELREEVGLDPAETDIRLLGWAIERCRGGKPQLFGAIFTNRAPHQLRASVERLPDHARESSECLFLDLANGTAALADIPDANFELRMNSRLLREWRQVT